MDVLSVRFGSPHAGERLTASLVGTGFAVLTDHPVSAELIREAYAEWEAFFASPGKHDHTFDPEAQDGYFPYRSENAEGRVQKDLKEFFHVYPKTKLPAGMSDRTRRLYDALSDLAGELLGLVVNCGDMLQTASGGHFRSTTHRVVNPTGAEARRARLSMPLFLHPRPEVRLSDRHTAGSYLEERLREIGFKSAG
jgi:isopenicillin N synthase-like dioxygenase